MKTRKNPCFGFSQWFHNLRNLRTSKPKKKSNTRNARKCINKQKNNLNKTPPKKKKSQGLPIFQTFCLSSLTQHHLLPCRTHSASCRRNSSPEQHTPNLSVPPRILALASQHLWLPTGHKMQSVPRAVMNRKGECHRQRESRCTILLGKQRNTKSKTTGQPQAPAD